VNNYYLNLYFGRAKVLLLILKLSKNDIYELDYMIFILILNRPVRLYYQEYDGNTKLMED